MTKSMILTVASLLIAAESFAVEVAYNELQSVRNSFWDTTERIGVTVDAEACEFAGGVDVSAFDVQCSNEFDLDTTKRGFVIIFR